MGEKRNFAALDWVVNEIDDTLKDARQALESYVEDPKDSTRLRFCLTHIHQVHGSLQMVEFHGASLLAEEMEQLAQAILNQSVSSATEAHEVLMRSLLQLPLYLDHVKTSKDDHPGIVLPLLNDLRAVRKQSLLTETNLFSPDLSVIKTVRGNKHPAASNPEKLVQVLKKLREMYQFAAASVLRGIGIEENLGYLDKVFSRLELLTQGTKSYPTWAVASAMIDGLVRDDIELSVAVRGLLRHLARELRLLSEKAPQSLNVEPRETLLKNLLYYVAGAEDGSEKIARIKDDYKLDSALLKGSAGSDGRDRDGLSAPDPEAVRSVVVALSDELYSIQRILEEAISHDSVDELKEILPVVKRVADTLAILGIGDLRKQVLQQNEVLELMSTSASVNEDVLMEVAGRFVEIEHRLEAISRVVGKNKDLENLDEREIEIDQAKVTVIRECQSGLDKAKDAIVEYISSKWDKDHLSNIGALLHDIRGGLDMIPLPRAGEILGECDRYIREKLVEGKEHPEWSSLDALADAISSVEYYLEQLANDFEEDADELLDVAEQSLAILGYGSGVTSEADKKGAHSQAEQALEEEIVVEQTIEEVVAQASPELEQALAEDDIQQQTVAPEEKVEPEIAEESLEAVEQESEPVAPVYESTAGSFDVDEDEEEDEIDDEIVEIFIEEAGEVRETLDEYFPKWQANMDDQDSLTVVRRAFHTLKGSGRMVNAHDIGELAWSVENMLNRVIDNTVSANSKHAELIGMVLDLLPTLIDAFAHNKPNPEHELAEQYMAWAKAMSEGQFPELVVRSSEPTAVTQVSEGEKDDGDEDEAQLLREIFSSEAKTHLTTVREFIKHQDQEAPIYSPPTNELQRALHTLKGSAKMAQITPIGGVAEPLELFVKELVTYQVSLTPDILQLIKDGVEYVNAGIQQIDRKEPVDIPRLPQFLARCVELRELSVGHLIHQKEAIKDGQKQVDPRLLSIFMAEEMELLLDADVLLDGWKAAPESKEKLPELIEELAALTEGAKQANLPAMERLSSDLNKLHIQLKNGQQSFDEDYYAIAREAHEALLDMVDAVAAGQLMAPPSENIVAALESLLLRGEPAQQEDVRVEEFIDQSIASDEEHESASVFLEDEDIVLSEELAIEPTEVEAPQAFNEDAFDSEEEIEIELVDEDEDSEEVFAENLELEGEIEVELPSDVPASNMESSAEEEQVHIPVPDDAGEVEEQVAELVEQSDTGAQFAGLLDTIDTQNEDFDSDILEVFLEEADELVEELDEAIHEWESNWSNYAAVDQIKRCLHTLKGGSRLAGLPNLGELTHEYESFLIAANLDVVDDAFFSQVHKYQDRVLGGVRAVRDFQESGAVYADANPDGKPEPVEPKAPESVQVEAPAVVEAKPEVKSGDTDSKGNVVPFAPKAKEVAPAPGDGGFSMPRTSGGGQQAATAVAKKAAPQEVVKVSSELLEELVNLAGETSISRGRLEEQVSDFSFSLDEMDATLARLQEQLRRLDIETEAQVLFRQEQMAAHDEFDPLEMDRYSQLQQLSRSLTESASDLVDLKNTLEDKVRDTETVLLQQSRINTTLQEGLMRSRMVPFSRLVPRLRRIVRQVASELGKNVSFELDNVEGELDRSVLERMVPPLEHMLRNAVDHGIEMPEDRIDAGKSESGRIVLTLGREGGDVIIRLADDGRGINLKRVREKAVERGLMAPDARLSDHEVLQFILHAGFSTAENVTHISGRGVGMDVVTSEIKQLGGSVKINSEWGKGTEFVIRLPFTVSVNRALMVTLGPDNYAVPLNSIEGIVRVSPFELEHYYNDPNARFEYAGENYQVRYLGSLLGSNTRPKLEGQALPLPVLLVRSAEHTMALQVDSLQGSREIVVKSLGQQFAAVQGLSGATVMGDGSVVVILDTHAIVREEIARATPQLPKMDDLLPQGEVEKVSTVMVVDDSVTVRKVTSRFLERNGFNVITAKDGVDAIQILQDTIPDVMLLDIEMPRMDGFEVAKNIRTTRRWKHLPIIMITSRTGDKHRDHAFSLGVDNYMGKPYQEDVLLESINDLLKKARAK